MISPELLEAAAPGAVRSAWPGIMDLDEIQAGGCPAFWEKALPGGDPGDVLRRCAHGDWFAFWNVACPYGYVLFVVRDAYPDEPPPPYRGEVAEMDFEYESPGDCAVAVFRFVVEGRLSSEDPAFFKKSGRDLMLYWPLGPEDPRRRGENRAPSPA